MCQQKESFRSLCWQGLLSHALYFNSVVQQYPRRHLYHEKTLNVDQQNRKIKLLGVSPRILVAQQDQTRLFGGPCLEVFGTLLLFGPEGLGIQIRPQAAFAAG